MKFSKKKSAEAKPDETSSAPEPAKETTAAEENKPAAPAVKRNAFGFVQYEGGIGKGSAS